MPKAAKKATKKAAPAPGPYDKVSLFEAKPRQFGVGQDIQPKRNLTRFVKWPRYVRLQRQRRVLSKRLRVPPSLNVFTKTMDKTTTMNVFKFLSGYKPETKQKKAERLRGEAEARAAGKTVEKSKPFVLKYGLNHVTGLIEQKKAQLVLIAHDVSPIELVLWLPNLCKKMNVPFAIVKNKANLGVLCNKKSATCVAVTRVKPEDKATFEKLVEAVNENYGQIYATASRKWGGNILGLKSQYKIDSRLAAVEREAAVKASA